MDLMLSPAVAPSTESMYPVSGYSEPVGMSVHEIIRHHHARLLVWLGRRLVVPEDAYDVAQESYIKLLKYRPRSDIRSNWAMLSSIAMNVARDLGRARRSRQMHAHVNIENLEIDAMVPSFERMLEAEQQLQCVLDAIDTLTPRCRQVFLLSRLEGMSYSGIAACCGISVKMVEKHISHALSVCTAALANR